MIYLDSSVALASLFTEDRTPRDSLWAEQLISSRLLEYEVWNRIHVHQRSGSHDHQVRNLIAEVTLIELTPVILERALKPFPVAVRTLDALHPASIEFLRARGETVELASYDNRLAAGARALGIPLAKL